MVSSRGDLHGRSPPQRSGNRFETKGLQRSWKNPPLLPRNHTAKLGLALRVGASRLGLVVVLQPAEPGYVHSHERAACTELARRIAALKKFDFAGDYEPSRSYPQPLYFVPRETLVGAASTRELGIRGEGDVFGGVVPHPFVATKAITHPLVSADAQAPEGWSHEFPEHVRDAVLTGHTVFTPKDAREAGALLLQHGAVRIKPVRETGGRGQVAVANAAALEAALGRHDPAQLARDGLVLEENLAHVVTRSVGQVRIGELVASYYGTQRLTTDNTGAEVYGGSDLLVARGDFDALLALPLPEDARLAASLARLYDGAAAECFPGFFASRRNYDVAEGMGFGGRARCGVLEQSWRIGGASGAEIAALEAFRADPALRTVRARTVEVYGDAAESPPGAIVYFRGVDDRVGAILKYVMVERP
jgi:hypothetical protein